MENERRKKVLTLCIIHEHPRVLLGLKKRGFGAGRWNGFGGKAQPGETIEAATTREFREEAGVEVGGLDKRGILEFEFVGNPEILEAHLFSGTILGGELRESEEMKPRWFNVQEIPFDSMWPADQYWFPLFLAGKKFKGKILFEGFDKVINMNLQELSEI